MKFLFFALSVTLAVFSFAQSKKISFKLGDVYKPPMNADDLSFFGNAKDGLINVYSKDAKLTIVRFYAKTLAPEVERTIELPGATKNFNSEQVVDLDGNYYWLHSDWDKDAQKEWMSFNRIDLEKGKLMTQGATMLETSRLSGDMAATGVWQAKYVNKYKFDFSAGNKKMLVSYRLLPEKRNDRKNYDKIGLHVFDQYMNKLWGTEFTMPYTEAVMDNADYTVDNNGNAYMLAKVYSSDKRREEDKETGKPGYHYEILKLTKDSKDPIQINLPANDNYIEKIHLLANDKNEIIITGLYSKKQRFDGYDGIFLAVMDKQNKITPFKNGYYPFPLEEMVKYESSKTKKRMEKDSDYLVPYLRVRHVIAEADGSTIIALEQFHEESPVAAVGSRSYNYFYYDDIFAAKIGATGNMEWFKKIPKKQWGNFSYSLGFKLIPDAAGYCFLYLDNINNLNLPEDEEPKAHIHHKGGQVMLTRIDNSGKISKEIVFDVKDEGDVAVEPTDFKRLDDTHFIGRVGVRNLLGLTKFRPLLITIN